MGWPSILTRTQFGPIFKNRSRVRNAETDASAELVNTMLWQIAGMNGLVPRAMAIGTVAGGAISVVRRWLSWDPNGTLPANELAFGYLGVGEFTWTFANATYSDDHGNMVALVVDYAEMSALRANTGGGLIDARNANGLINADQRSGTFTVRDANGTLADPPRFMARFY